MQREPEIIHATQIMLGVVHTTCKASSCSRSRGAEEGAFLEAPERL